MAMVSTSNAIKAAVNNALDPVAFPYVVEEPKAVEAISVEAAEATIGLGVASMGRLGPGKDDKDVQVYSFNQVVAGVVFDAEGRILLSKFDQLEVATPNYDGATMPHLSGFPGQTPYNNDSDHDAKIDGVVEMTNDSFLVEVESWQTKRERGEGYVMGTGYWAQQMDTFQQLFEGKTVEEINAWFAAYCSDRNGRPLKAGSSNEQDAAKYDALSDDEKAMLADVTAGATMSLNDGHGNLMVQWQQSDEDVQWFINTKDNNTYIMEEFVNGYVQTYDAIIDSHGQPLFESGNVTPHSLMDIVNEGGDSVYYLVKELPEKVRNAGLATVESFGVKSRFVHLEFFILNEDQEGLGKKGDILGLEVNMRPAGGFTPEMYNYSQETDVYKIWADMVAFDCNTKDIGNHHYCAFYGRRDGRHYRLSDEQVMEKYGRCMVMWGRIPDALSGAMANQMYVCNFDTEEEMMTFFV